MPDDQRDRGETPARDDFLAKLHGAEERCASETWRTLVSRQAGERVARCLDALSELLSLTFLAASGHWRCKRPDQRVNNLATRIATSAAASLRCLEAGYYDESLVLTRSIGELGHLLLLFVRSPGEWEKWCSASRRERIIQFGPEAVRRSLTRILGNPPPIDQKRYSALSEVGVHATPDTVPQAHNPSRSAFLGHVFQPVGAILAVGELSIATCLASHQASRLLDLPNDVRAKFDSCAGRLIDTLPVINLENLDSVLTFLAANLKPEEKGDDD